ITMFMRLDCLMIATLEIYSLSLHDALPIFPAWSVQDPALPAAFGDQRLRVVGVAQQDQRAAEAGAALFVGHALQGVQEFGDIARDRKSTRLNSSHVKISYAVFCLKKKKII